MKSSTAFAILFLFGVSAAEVVATLSDDKPVVIRDFVPLSCNANGYSACRPWSTVFGKRLQQNSRLYIPCGECVEMDIPAVHLRQGMDVQGKWLIRQPVNITTTGIFIQGLWEIQVGNKKNPAISGTPLVHVTMTGEEDQAYTPILENADACGGDDCTIGMKGIVVAGGTADIRGLADDTPTWLKLYDVTKPRKFPRGIIVDNSVMGHWAVGAELLITAHSPQWDDHQVRSIVSIEPSPDDDNHVVITLDSPIARPTTLKESPDFAVEVALLSRNILFEGGPDSVPHRGGHFWVMNTPGVSQTIFGLEVRRFGQQGYLGRYPIHLHFCGDSGKTTIAKNTIRHSNQRCVVVHGTNKLDIRENIAYDTKGHCFMLEDGMETENQFMYNLGAQTGVPENIIPNQGPNGNETDYDPSTFWITNPSNTFVGNVAAGSESSGFWFELLVRGERAHLFKDLNPKIAPLGQFRDNVAHSCFGKAFRTYPSGYVPDEEAVFLGLKAYRNANTGVFFHNSRNLAVVNGLFADNRFSLDIDRSERVRVQRSTFVGRSTSYSNYLEDMGIPNTCRRDNWPVVGVEMHTWKNRLDEDGATFRNVTFTGFNGHPCTKTVPIVLDGTTKTEVFDHFSSFRNVVFERNTDAIDFCPATEAGINDIYFTDLTGNTFAEGDFRGTSTILSDDPLMLAFADESRCTANTERCYSLCEDTCFFTGRFEIDPSETFLHKLKVCRKDAPRSCVWFGGYHRSEDYEFGMRHRAFAAHLPSGIYEAEFVDEAGEKAWPSFANLIQDTNFCPSQLDTEIQLRIPIVKRRDCQELIKNGDMAASDSDPTYWVYRFGNGIQVIPKVGVSGSNAVAGNAEKTRSMLGQYLDNRCFSSMEGSRYKIIASVKVIGNDGKKLKCRIGDRNGCPYVGIHTQRGGFSNIAKVTEEPNLDDYQTFVGEFDIDGMFGLDDEVFFYVDSTIPGSQIFLDNVSVALYTQAPQAAQGDEDDKQLSSSPTTSPTVQELVAPKTKRCGSLIASSDDGLWGTKGFGTILPAKSGSGVHFTDRIFSWNGPSFVGGNRIDYSCLTFGSSWVVSVSIKLTETLSGDAVDCVAGWTCPALRVAITDANSKFISLQNIARHVDSPWNANGFNEIKTFIDLPRKHSWDGTVGDMFADIRDYPIGIDVIVDHFSITQAK